MKVNIYYGGRGLIDDPTIFAVKKIITVLEELNIKVMRYNLYEDKRGIAVLPKTLKEASDAAKDMLNKDPELKLENNVYLKQKVAEYTIKCLEKINL